MRIISWNIRAGGGRRVGDIFNQLQRWQPHVVALSEFRATPPSKYLAKALATCGLEYQITTATAENKKTNALLLASRYPLQQLYLQSEPQDPYRWLLARVESIHPFVIGVMHVPNKVSGRKYLFHAEVLAVTKAWKFGPGLLIGDTNSGMPGLDEETAVFGPQEQAWLEALEAQGWLDVFRHLKGDLRAFTWYSPNGKNGFRLDQAFLNQELISYTGDIRYEWGSPAQGPYDRRDILSDHAAIILELRR
jgi:exodeoxyribonuclease III